MSLNTFTSSFLRFTLVSLYRHASIVDWHRDRLIRLICKLVARYLWFEMVHGFHRVEVHLKIVFLIRETWIFP